MRTDSYTKLVVTVIVGCLLWICAMDGGASIRAQQPLAFDAAAFAGHIQPVVIVGTGTMDSKGAVSVNFVTRSGAQVTDPTLRVTLPYNADAPLPVRLPYSSSSPMPAQLFYSAGAPLPVEITGIKRTLDWEPIRTRVEDADVRRTPGR